MESLNNPGKKWRNFLISILLLGALLVIGLNFYRSWTRTEEVNQEISQLQENIETLEQDNQEFRELIEYFNSDAYVEERARIDLGLKKPGEKVAVIPKGNIPDLTSDSEIDNDGRQDDQTNPKKWWHYFFN